MITAVADLVFWVFLNTFTPFSEHIYLEFPEMCLFRCFSLFGLADIEQLNN